MGSRIRSRGLAKLCVAPIFLSFLAQIVLCARTSAGAQEISRQVADGEKPPVVAETPVKGTSEVKEGEKADKPDTDGKAEAVVKEEEKEVKLQFQRDIEMTKIRKHFLNKRTAEMEKALRMYASRYPVETDSEYHFYTGFVNETRGEYRKAVESYLLAVEISPDYARARNSLANLYCRLSKHQFALAHYRRALEINPYNPFIQYNIGNLYFETGDIESAIPHLISAVKYKNNFGSAYHKLGVVYYHKKQYQQCIENFKKARAFKAESPISHYYTGLAYYNLEKGSLAIASLKQALRVKPDFFEAALELGNLYFSYGEYASAVEYYKKADALNPEYRELKMKLVESYRELRDYKEAITIVKQLMEKEPENEQLKKYLRNLQEKRLLENLVEPYDYYTY